MKVDLKSTELKNMVKNHFVKLLYGDLEFQHRAADAFFIPTEYGARYRFHRPKFDESDKYQRKQIFSELDKIRIFNVFLKNFSESEYWVISNFNLRPQNGKKFEKIHFVTGIERGFEADHGVKKLYDCETQILFKDEHDGR